jgi:hypothetical protein
LLKREIYNREIIKRKGAVLWLAHPKDDESTAPIHNPSLDDSKRDLLIFELIKRRLDNEWRRINDLDSKANNLVGFVSVVISLLLGAATFKLSSTLVCKTNLSILYFLGISILLTSIIFALTGSKVRRWSDVPDVQYLIENYTNLPYDDVLKRNAGEMANAVVQIEKQNNHKARLIKWSWYMLIIGLATVLLFMVIFTSIGAVACNNVE